MDFVENLLIKVLCRANEHLKIIKLRRIISNVQEGRGKAGVIR